MTKEDILKTITTISNHVLFQYNGKQCGIDPLSYTHIEMWYGKDYYIAKSIDEVFEVPVFDGLNLKEIIDYAADSRYDEAETIAMNFALTATEQRVMYVSKWNGCYVFQHLIDNPWGNHGKGDSTRDHFILVKDGVARYETPEELEILTDLVD